MNGLPYYKAYPRDFIEGTIGMSFELKAAYRLVLDLIYMQGGNLPDDARYISGLLGCTLRKWNSLRGELISLGKIEINGEFLTNKRAIIELETARKYTEKQSENRSSLNKNKGLKSPPINHTEPYTEPEEASASSVRAPEAPPTGGEKLVSLRRRIVAEYAPSLPPDTGYAAVWIGQGYDPEICMGVISGIVQRGRKPATLKYFDSAIHDAHQRKAPAIAQAKPVTPVDPAKVTPSRWHKLLDDWHSSPKDWPSAVYGPAPGEPGCVCPQEIIDLENERRGKVAA